MSDGYYEGAVCLDSIKRPWRAHLISGRKIVRPYHADGWSEDVAVEHPCGKVTEIGSGPTSEIGARVQAAIEAWEAEQRG